MDEKELFVTAIIEDIRVLAGKIGAISRVGPKEVYKVLSDDGTISKKSLCGIAYDFEKIQSLSNEISKKIRESGL